MTQSQQLSGPGTTTGARRRRPVHIIAPIVNTYSRVTALGQQDSPRVHEVESTSDSEPEQLAS